MHAGARKAVAEIRDAPDREHAERAIGVFAGDDGVKWPKAVAKITRGPGSRAAGLAMAFKLIQAAQDRWRAVNGPHLVALVRAGARFDKGVIIERPDEPVQEVAA